MTEHIQALNIAAMNEAGLALLAQIHRRAFEPQADTVWQAAVFRQLLESPGVHGYVYQTKDEPFGLCLYRVVAGEAELISLAVDPVFQKQGLANHVMRDLLARLKEAGASQLFLEVRIDNRSALDLYYRFGLKQVGIRKKYYKKSNGDLADAVVLSCELNK